MDPGNEVETGGALLYFTSNDTLKEFVPPALSFHSPVQNSVG
jgi:hypothetical protein